MRAFSAALITISSLTEFPALAQSMASMHGVEHGAT
jgi:hypothetical protein